MNRKSRVILLAVMAVAFAIRLLAIGEFGSSRIRFGDGPDYLSAASSLCSAGSYPDRSSMPFFRAPGLPFFIAMTTLCHTESVWLVKVALAVVDVFSVALIYLLSQELFRNPVASLAAAFFAAIYPFFIAQVCDVQSEALFMFLFLAAVWSTLAAGRIRHPSLLLIAGVCAGDAALVRPVGLVLLPLLAVGSVVFGAMGRKRRLLLFAIGTVLSLGPWVTRNELRYHEFILVNDAGGYNLWRGTSAELVDINRISNPDEFEQASLRFETVTSPAIARRIDTVADTPLGRSREWYKLAGGAFHRDPVAFIGRMARNAVTFWRPWLKAQTHSRAVVFGSGLLVAMLYSGALWGWNILRRRDRRLAICCVTGAVCLWIPQAGFQVVSRFRVPVADPFLIILAAAALFRRVRCGLC